MSDEVYEVILSDLSENFTQDDKSVRIDIYQDGDDGWILEVVDQFNNSTIWDDSFPTDVAALNEAHEAIATEGIDALIGEKSFSVVH